MAAVAHRQIIWPDLFFWEELRTCSVHTDTFAEKRGRGEIGLRKTKTIRKLKGGAD